MKYFLNYEVVRNNALKLADKIYRKDNTEYVISREY